MLVPVASILALAVRCSQTSEQTEVNRENRVPVVVPEALVPAAQVHKEALEEPGGEDGCTSAIVGTLQTMEG